MLDVKRWQAKLFLHILPEVRDLPLLRITVLQNADDGPIYIKLLGQILYIAKPFPYLLLAGHLRPSPIDAGAHDISQVALGKPI